MESLVRFYKTPNDLFGFKKQKPEKQHKKKYKRQYKKKQILAKGNALIKSHRFLNFNIYKTAAITFSKSTLVNNRSKPSARRTKIIPLF